MSQIEITNAGPVSSFAIDLSSGPGVYELRGSKGTGKTTVLRSLEILAGRKTTITVTDGELSGGVKGFGVVSPIGGRRRRKGELEVDALDGNYGLDDLVSPPIQDPAAADAHRIKALISLRNVLAEPADYYDLAGGREALERLVGPERLGTDDPILLATRVKAALEQLARQQEDRAKLERQYSTAGQLATDGLDLTAESDRAVLESRYDEARTALVRLESDQKHHYVETLRHEKAQASLDAEIARYTGPSAETAELDVKQVEECLQWSTERVAKLKQDLMLAESDCKVATVALDRAKAVRQAAVAHEQSVSSWQAILAEKVPPPVSDDEMAAARQAQQEARQRMETGVLVRKAQETLETAQRHRTAAEEAERAANAWREKAASVFDVLSQLVHCPGIRIESVDGVPRLVVDHPKRGKTLYAECSDGERVRYGMDATLDTLTAPALMTPGQRVWQDLPPADRIAIASYCEAHGIYCFGAQVDDGDLRVVKIGNGQEG